MYSLHNFLFHIKIYIIIHSACTQVAWLQRCPNCQKLEPVSIQLILNGMLVNHRLNLGRTFYSSGCPKSLPVFIHTLGLRAKLCKLRCMKSVLFHSWRHARLQFSHPNQPYLVQCPGFSPAGESFLFCAPYKLNDFNYHQDQNTMALSSIQTMGDLIHSLKSWL